nr:hypothetical protein Iba_chr11bCG14390 [Ipomoea batatas]
MLLVIQIVIKSSNAGAFLDCFGVELSAVSPHIVQTNKELASGASHSNIPNIASFHSSARAVSYPDEFKLFAYGFSFALRAALMLAGNMLYSAKAAAPRLSGGALINLLFESNLNALLKTELLCTEIGCAVEVGFRGGPEQKAFVLVVFGIGPDLVRRLEMGSEENLERLL